MHLSAAVTLNTVFRVVHGTAYKVIIEMQLPEKIYLPVEELNPPHRRRNEKYLHSAIPPS